MNTSSEFVVAAVSWGGLALDELAVARWTGGSSRLQLAEAVILGALLRGAGRPVSMRRLLDMLYAHDPNGGPLDADRGVTVRMCHIRKKIAASPVGIGTRVRIGYYLFERASGAPEDFQLSGRRRSL